MVEGTLIKHASLCEFDTEGVFIVAGMVTGNEIHFVDRRLTLWPIPIINCCIFTRRGVQERTYTLSTGEYAEYEKCTRSTGL